MILSIFPGTEKKGHDLVMVSLGFACNLAHTCHRKKMTKGSCILKVISTSILDKWVIVKERSWHHGGCSYSLVIHMELILILISLSWAAILLISYLNKLGFSLSYAPNMALDIWTKKIMVISGTFLQSWVGWQLNWSVISQQHCKH